MANENEKTIDVIVEDGVAKEVNTEETKKEENKAEEKKENKDMNEEAKKEETKQEETKEETKQEEKKEDKKENKNMKKKISTKKKVFIGLGVATLVAAAGAVIYNCMKKDDTNDTNDGGCTVTFF